MEIIRISRRFVRIKIAMCVTIHIGAVGLFLFLIGSFGELSRTYLYGFYLPLMVTTGVIIILEIRQTVGRQSIQLYPDHMVFRFGYESGPNVFAFNSPDEWELNESKSWWVLKSTIDKSTKTISKDAYPALLEKVNEFYDAYRT